jgi:sialic acid synthase SpsE
MSPDVPEIWIDGRRVSRAVPPFVIAEIGLNHGGSADRALALVDAAARAGAHAVKLQSLEAAALVAPACPAPAHVEADSLVDFFARFELDEAAHHAVVARARALGLRVLSTPLSEPAVDMLERADVDGYKIASGDLTWDALIARCAATRKPLIISTGMASLADVEHAVVVARRAGATDLALLHCVSAYPVPRGSENLQALGTLAGTFDVPVGLSDHATDAFALPLAVALGAAVYERHLILERDGSSIDEAVSSTPDELAAAIAAARRAWDALGSGQKACLRAEAPNLVPSRRSLCAARDLPAGTTLRRADLVALRPATGLAPSSLPLIEGLVLSRALVRGEPLTLGHLHSPSVQEAHRVA